MARLDFAGARCFRASTPAMLVSIFKQVSFATWDQQILSMGSWLVRMQMQVPLGIYFILHHTTQPWTRGGWYPVGYNTNAVGLGEDAPARSGKEKSGVNFPDACESDVVVERGSD